MRLRSARLSGRLVRGDGAWVRAGSSARGSEAASTHVPIADRLVANELIGHAECRHRGTVSRVCHAFVLAARSDQGVGSLRGLAGRLAEDRKRCPEDDDGAEPLALIEPLAQEQRTRGDADERDEIERNRGE